MKNTSRKPYIYKVTNLETGQYYIGSQCRGKIIGKNYFTSSTNKLFKEDFKTYGEEKYEITIIKSFTDPKECGRAENYIIRNRMQLKDGLCLNRSYVCSGEKIFNRLGLPAWNKGIPHSEETRKKLSRNSSNRIKISIEGMVFDSRKEASKYHKVSVEAIRRWLKNKKHNAVYIEK